MAVRWYLRYGLSYRDVEELASAASTLTTSRSTAGVQTFTAEFIDAARPARHATGDRWFVDETYVEVAGRWTYLYRAVDQHGQVIDVLVSQRRDGEAARAFFARALTHRPSPVEVAGNGSDRLLDGLMAIGDAQLVADRATAHLDAGADHVCLYLVTSDGADLLPSYTEIANILFA